MASPRKLTEIKHIDPMSFGKIYAVIMAIVGFIYGIIIVGLIAPLMAVYGGAASVGMMAGLGIIGIVLMVILFAILGFIAGVIGAWIYNIVASRIGGIRIELSR